MDDYIFDGALKANDIKLYSQEGEEIWNLGCGNCALTTPMSAKSNPPVIQSLITNHPAEFTCENVQLNTLLLDSMLEAPKTPVKVYWDMPIMIQARWHKKSRVNKKWLKRYGMKPDVIKVEMNIKELTYEPGHTVGYDETGIRSTFNSWNFETDIPIYKYRPDQMRRNLKIQW